MSEWKDSTSYSRGERGSTEPRAWDLDLDGLRVTVHRIHRIDGLWFGTCYAMGITDKQLGRPDIESARHEFLMLCVGRANRWAEKLRAALESENRKRTMTTNTRGLG